MDVNINNSVTYISSNTRIEFPNDRECITSTGCCSFISGISSNYLYIFISDEDINYFLKHVNLVCKEKHTIYSIIDILEEDFSLKVEGIYKHTNVNFRALKTGLVFEFSILPKDDNPKLIEYTKGNHSRMKERYYYFTMIRNLYYYQDVLSLYIEHRHRLRTMRAKVLFMRSVSTNVNNYICSYTHQNIITTPEKLLSNVLENSNATSVVTYYTSGKTSFRRMVEMDTAVHSKMRSIISSDPSTLNDKTLTFSKLEGDNVYVVSNEKLDDYIYYDNILRSSSCRIRYKNNSVNYTRINTAYNKYINSNIFMNSTLSKTNASTLSMHGINQDIGAQLGNIFTDRIYTHIINKSEAVLFYKSKKNVKAYCVEMGYNTILKTKAKEISYAYMTREGIFSNSLTSLSKLLTDRLYLLFESTGLDIGYISYTVKDGELYIINISSGIHSVVKKLPHFYEYKIQLVKLKNKMLCVD